ncbi:MAG TPA: hypothetical protein VFX25_19800 [Streptosporangiaceae bacterium]|nr:hypothetical protein [Streptosporangiaceae bacterium]
MLNVPPKAMTLLPSVPLSVERGDVLAVDVPGRGVLDEAVDRLAEGAGDLLLQLLEEPDWRHGEREASSDDR